MSLCAACRVALRQAVRQHRRPLSTTTPAAGTATAASSIRAMLSTPSWSVSTLFAEDDDAASPAAAAETVTPAQLRHLLRLSALPPPRSPEEEASMTATIQSQLRFVRAVQQVDTAGVEPLRAIRDETRAAVRETTIGLRDVRDLLDRENRVGHYRRPKRVRERVASAAEEWDALATASRRAGRYFVVDGGRRDSAGITRGDT